MLDSKHPLFKLANMVDWSLFENSFVPLFCADNGRPPKPIRMMTDLLMLKHLRNVSDEQVIAQFAKNVSEKNANFFQKNGVLFVKIADLFCQNGVLVFGVCNYPMSFLVAAHTFYNFGFLQFG